MGVRALRNLLCICVFMGCEEFVSQYENLLRYEDFCMNTFAQSPVNEREFLRIGLEENTDRYLNHLQVLASTLCVD